MLLTVDMGNTNMTLGIYNDDKLMFVSRMATDKTRMEDQYAMEFMNILNIYNVSRNDIDGAIISSVVPSLTSYIKIAIKKVFDVEPLVVSADIVDNLSVKGGKLSDLGADLIVGCLAAKTFYSYPNIVIDLGTASTIMVTDENGEVLGGSILPGPRIALDALTGGTAQLSSVSLESPPSVIGYDTTTCIQSGIIVGTACLIDGLCERIEKELGYSCITIATGGLAKTIIENCNRDINFSDTLLLDGLKLIYDNNIKK